MGILMSREKMLAELYDLESRIKTMKVLRDKILDHLKEIGSFSAGEYVFLVEEHVRRSVRIGEMIEAFGEKTLAKKGLIHENKVVTTKVAKKAA